MFVFSENAYAPTSPRTADNGLRHYRRWQRRGCTQLVLVPFALPPVQFSEIVHTGKRIGIIGAKLGFAKFERLFVERQGQVQLPSSQIHLAEIAEPDVVNMGTFAESSTVSSYCFAYVAKSAKLPM